MAQSLDLSFLKVRAVQRRIVYIAAAGALLGGLYGKFAPKWYQATVTLVPVKAPGTAIPSLLGSDLGGLAASVAGIGGGLADTARIVAVLQSGAVTDAAIEKFGLADRYGTSYPEATRDAVWKHCGVKALPKPGLVQLWCEDKDPATVQAMLLHFAENGNQVFRRVSVSSASEEVRFLDRRVAELRQQAEDAAGRMREFQEKHQIVDLDTQAKALVSSTAALHGQRIAKQLELDYARTFSSPDESTARQLESQLSVVDDKLRALEEPRELARPGPRRSRGPEGSSLFPAALAVPKLRSEYERLYRDRRVAEAMLIFALERLEGARANEARDVSTFQVLDPPTRPTRKSRPRASETLLIGGLAGVVGGVAWEWWRKRRAPG